MGRMVIEPYEIAQAGAWLISDNGENSEYDRAICELICDTVGIHMDYKDRVLEILRNIRATGAVRV